MKWKCPKLARHRFLYNKRTCPAPRRDKTGSLWAFTRLLPRPHSAIYGMTSLLMIFLQHRLSEVRVSCFRCRHRYLRGLCRRRSRRTPDHPAAGSRGLHMFRRLSVMQQLSVRKCRSVCIHTVQDRCSRIRSGSFRPIRVNDSLSAARR